MCKNHPADPDRMRIESGMFTGMIFCSYFTERLFVSSPPVGKDDTV